MTARNAIVECAADDWTELTASSCLTDVALALLDTQRWASQPVYLNVTNDGNDPASPASGLPIWSFGDGFKESTLAEIFTGVDLSSAAHLFAWPVGTAAKIFVTHATA